ncbi:MAG: peptidoglycan D,D-transpeptidase FtsI family protein [Candidatus Eiseniibacteriota bacterium]
MISRPSRIRQTCGPAPLDDQRGLGRARLDGPAKAALETGRTRLLMAAGAFTLGFLAVAVRLGDVSLIKESNEPRIARVVTAAEPVHRADIRDRNGTVLATSLVTHSLYADPAQILDPHEAAVKLARVLPDLDVKQVEADLRSDRRFVWLQRHLTPQQYYQVNRLGIPGLSFRQDERRVYPQGPLAAQILGFTDIDEHGIAGVEKYFDKALATGAKPLELSLDMRVQYVLREELQAQMLKHKAIGASGLVMDVTTGEVIASVSLPDFDPNDPMNAPKEARFNRNTLGTYEMGSTFKIFTVATALESGTAKLTDRFDATHPIHVARFSIRDYHALNRWLSVPEIFVHSSNIGAVRMALEFGTERQQEYLKRFGLLKPASIELPEIGEPQIPNPWRPINTMTIAFGHGMAVSPLQLAHAVSAIANDGVMVPTTIVKRMPEEKYAGHRVVSSSTARQVQSLMRQVVLDGTGRKAEAPGYLVGGKTGSTDKKGLSGRIHGLLSLFVGAFPMNQPRYLVLAIVDDPKGTKDTYGFATGGWIAAPVVGHTVTRIAPLLGVKPLDEKSVEPDMGTKVAAAPTGGTRANGASNRDPGANSRERAVASY